MNYTPLFIFLFVLKACSADYEEIVINESIDQNLIRIREFISEIDFDPLKLPNITATLLVNFFFLNESVSLNLTNGYLSGGSTVERAGNFYLTFHARTVRLHGRIYFEEMKGNFNFSYDTRFYSDKGVLDATIKNITVSLRVDFKLLELLVVNPKIKLENYGDLDFTMTTNALFSPITNVIAVVVSSHYKQEVLKLADGIALDITRQVLRKVNKNLPKWVSTISANLLQDALNGRLGQEVINYYNKKSAKK